MPLILSVDSFLNSTLPLLDTRSPSEYIQGHIPHAVNLPLFNDEERCRIGTTYKQIGPDQAIELGLEIVGPKMVKLVRQAKEIAADKKVRIHCWRGGMRSNSLAWLLEQVGFEVQLLEGGYKSFRRWGRALLEQPKPIVLLGGMTGSGKTELLHELAKQEEQILDLEQIANHRGSSFGAIGLPPQPTQEQFENNLAIAWSQFNPQKRVWIEAESRRIGLCRIPDELLKQMRESTTLQVARPINERLEILEKIYGQCDHEELIKATERISKHLGGLNTTLAVEEIRNNNLKPAIAIVLAYYDKTYTYDLHRYTSPIITVQSDGICNVKLAKKLIDEADQISLVRQKSA